MSTDRIAYITKKRSVLKGQITNLHSAVSRNDLDNTNVKLRFARLTELFHEYEELHVELEIIIRGDAK